MKPAFYSFLLLGVIFINFGCKNKSTDPALKPAPVTLVPGGGDTTAVETGIDAVPEGNLIHLEWTQVENASVVAFSVFRKAEREKEFAKLVTIEAPVRFYDDPVPFLDVRYYYFVRAVSDEGLESEPSDTLSYKLIQKAESMTPEGKTDAKPMFRWRDLYHANDYVIRVQESLSESVTWISRFQKPQYGPDEQYVQYNADGRARLDSLVKGRAYEWRIDVLGNEASCGSESRWVPIQIQ
jgi:hypothetical protein